MSKPLIKPHRMIPDVTTLRKDTARVFYMNKGHIPPWILLCPEEELKGTHDRYLSKVWYNEESYLNEEGFDEEWDRLTK